MGNIVTTPNLEAKTVLTDWSALTDEQLYWAGRHAGYPPKIEQDGVMIDNPVPIFIWIQAKKLKEISDGAYLQYKLETPDPRLAMVDPREEVAQEIADFLP